MRDTTEIMSSVVYAALNGNVTYDGQNIPVFDEKKKVNSTADLFILFSTQQETNDNPQGYFFTESSLDLEICHKTGSEVSKTALSGVANSVLEILFPTPATVGITEPSGFQIQHFRFAGSITRTFEISPTESIVRKFIKITATIVQQN